MRERRFSLGAEELIELGSGRVGVNLDRKPFLSGRTKSVRLSLGSSAVPVEMSAVDMLSEVAPYVANRLADALEALGDITGVSVASLGQSVDFATAKLSGLVKRIPSLSLLLGQILVSAGVLAQYGLSAPNILLRNLGNLMAGAASALRNSMGAGELDGMIDTAKEEVVGQAEPSIKDALQTILGGLGVTGGNLAPSVNAGTGQVTLAPLA